MITQIETMVLERMAENLTTPDVWTGEGDQVRNAVQSAIDELLALGLFHKEFVQIELSKNKSVYRMTELGTIVGVLSARLESQTRILSHKTLAWISANDRLFLKTRGTPWIYSVLDFTKILVYPTPSVGGDVLELECFLIPEPYVGGEWVSEIPGELTEAIVSLAVCNLQLLVPGGLPMAVQAFQDFMTAVPWATEQRKSWNSYLHFWQKGLVNGNGS
jgi:hypothetical protein